MKCHVLTFQKLTPHRKRSYKLTTWYAIFQLKYNLDTTYQRQFMKSTIKIQMQCFKSNYFMKVCISEFSIKTKWFLPAKVLTLLFLNTRNNQTATKTKRMLNSVRSQRLLTKISQDYMPLESQFRVIKMTPHYLTFIFPK